MTSEEQDALRALAESMPREPWFPGDNPQASYLAAVHPERVLSLLDALRGYSRVIDTLTTDVAAWRDRCIESQVRANHAEARAEAAESKAILASGHVDAARDQILRLTDLYAAADKRAEAAEARLERAREALKSIDSLQFPDGPDEAVDAWEKAIDKFQADLRAALLGEGGPT